MRLSLTSSQEPVTGARAGVSEGFACQAAVWGSKPSAATKASAAVHIHQEHPGPDGHTATPGCSHTRLANPNVGGV